MTGDLQPLIGDVRPHAHLRISKFSQHFIDVLDLSMTPLDFFMHLWPDMSREDSRKFLGRYGISGSVQTQIMGQLSDGQKSRVVLAKMAKENPHILFLDEPTNHLDMESIDSLAKAINGFSGGMILVSHDMRLISQVAREIWVCDNQTVTKYVGEISDFKMQLKRDMQKANIMDGDPAAGSTSAPASKLVPLTPLTKKITPASGASGATAAAHDPNAKVSLGKYSSMHLKIDNRYYLLCGIMIRKCVLLVRYVSPQPCSACVCVFVCVCVCVCVCVSNMHGGVCLYLCEL